MDKCTVCKSKSIDYVSDKEVIIDFAKSILSLVTIKGWVKTIDSIIEDIQSQKVESYAHLKKCSNCENFYVNCPNCDELVCLGYSSSCFDKKMHKIYTCSRCLKEFTIAVTTNLL